MKLRTIFLFFVLITSLVHCGEVVMDQDPDLSLGLESIYYYKGQKFSGKMKSIHPNGTVRITTFLNGLEDGLTSDTYPNGQISAEYFYKQGKRIGTHRGWYEDGKARFQFSYIDDLADGDHWEWYESGKVFRYAKFNKGLNVGTKVWRKDGKIYSNYTYSPERLYGVVGSKLCFKLKGDETNQKTVINP
ncbi:toxin-antitoxin system YwqK family antitoxin [Leptospira bandrabouensis]|uniref:toxin-antitoxin system YwqK family antitoxin n=1 Tax=Leptospira bandrabouensis TaxID=2484903 RepID=UPI001EE81521|nr:membrane-binding protein [Leptospira bandrabouensis]MCG6144560.1 membrane-binding protein [Leptospira bandrabouensis]MCG6150432.1 membrane-binding protein [Leptospira bandrabouensis]MCG6160221.1 membrane-binding protein [Leptospira bandrabouensis]MCG6164154.1 membrane-binding protein [Leptospira bandrabouensis]